MRKDLTNAYLAGIIDADGYIGLIKRYTGGRNDLQKNFFVPVIKLASTTPVITDFLKKEFGGHIDKARFSNLPNTKPAVMWSVRNRKIIIEILNRIEPYLMIKKERAETVLAFIEECKIGRQDLVPEENRIAYYNKMKILNRRGLATTE